MVLSEHLNGALPPDVLRELYSVLTEVPQLSSVILNFFAQISTSIPEGIKDTVAPVVENAADKVEWQIKYNNEIVTAIILTILAIGLMDYMKNHPRDNSHDKKTAEDIEEILEHDDWM